MHYTASDPALLKQEEMNESNLMKHYTFYLEKLHARISFRFIRSETRRRSLAYLQGLLFSSQRKNGEQLARYSGENNPDGMQRLLNTAVWDADQVENDLRAYIAEHLNDSQGILVISEASFPKKGLSSVGVENQYSSTTGKIENCQVGVFIAYDSSKGYVLVDRELYLSEKWIEDITRREKSGIPPEVSFKTEPQLAISMLERIYNANISTSWVVGGRVCGNDQRLREWLECRRLAYILTVPSQDPVCTLMNNKSFSIYNNDRSVSKETAMYEQYHGYLDQRKTKKYFWACKLIKRVAVPGWSHWLLERRQVNVPGRVLYYRIFAPERTSFDEMLRIVEQYQATRKKLELMRKEVGLGEYEVKHWHSWYRHITLAMLAQTCLTVARYYMFKENDKTSANVGLQTSKGE